MVLSGAESEIPELSPAQASPYPVLQLFVVLTNTSASERTESDTLGRKLQEMDTSIVADDILFSITFVPRSPSEDLLRDIPSNDTDLFLDDMAANGNLTLFDKSLRIAVLPVVNGTGSAHVPVTRTHHSFKAVYDGLTFENATIVVTVINPDGSWQPAEEVRGIDEGPRALHAYACQYFIGVAASWYFFLPCKQLNRLL